MDKTEHTRNAADSNRDDTEQQDRTACGNSGLDTLGQMRIADRVTIQARGGTLMLIQSNTGRQVEVAEEVLAGLLEDEYFIDKVD